MARISRLVILVAAATALTSATGAVHATSNHKYAKGEYATIHHGLAPNKQMSLASHGAGDDGDEDFHVWLMSEPGHRRIMALPDISSDNNLDTAPDAYHAFWSPGARYVAVIFRTDRHELGLNLYSIEKGRAQPIAAPNLFKAVTRREVVEADDRHELGSSIAWVRDGHFVLKEYQGFVASDPEFLKLLGAYGHVREKLDGGKLDIVFAAEADCVLEAEHHYRIIDLKPANPDQQPDW